MERFSLRYTFKDTLTDSCAADAVAKLKERADTLSADLTAYCHSTITGAKDDNVTVKVHADRISTNYKQATVRYQAMTKGPPIDNRTGGWE
jgi:hypothetical protein